MMRIDDLNECKNAVSWIQTLYEGTVGDVNMVSDKLHPRGCNVFVHKNDSYGIFFNTDPSDKPNEYSRQVCVSGKFFNSFHLIDI